MANRKSAPRSPTDNVIDALSTETSFLGDCDYGHSRGRERDDCLTACSTFRVPIRTQVPLSLRVRMLGPILDSHIPLVVTEGAEKHVVGPDAGSRVALVAYEESIRNRAIFEFVGNSMGSKRFVVAGNLAVAVGV